eukprot:jgi/Undpi1/5446/HiC_scaffold_2.g00725.m1
MIPDNILTASKKDYKFNAKEVLRYLDEGKVLRTRRYAKPCRETCMITDTGIGQREEKRACLQPHASTLPPDERAQGIAKMSTGLGINLSAKEDDAAAKIHQSREEATSINTGNSGRPSSVLKNREKVVSQILRLDQSKHPPTSFELHASTLPPEGRARTEDIAKMATALGIMSPKEANFAIRRHAALTRMEAPAFRAPPRLHTADLIANERLIIRQPYGGVIFANDYFAAGGDDDDDDDDLLVPPITTTTTTNPLDGRPRTTRRRVGTAQSTIARALNPSRRTLGHLSVRIWWLVGHNSAGDENCREADVDVREGTAPIVFGRTAHDARSRYKQGSTGSGRDRHRFVCAPLFCPQSKRFAAT